MPSALGFNHSHGEQENGLNPALPDSWLKIRCLWKTPEHIEPAYLRDKVALTIDERAGLAWINGASAIDVKAGQLTLTGPDGRQLMLERAE